MLRETFKNVFLVIVLRFNHLFKSIHKLNSSLLPFHFCFSIYIFHLLSFFLSFFFHNLLIYFLNFISLSYFSFRVFFFFSTNFFISSNSVKKDQTQKISQNLSTSCQILIRHFKNHIDSFWLKTDESNFLFFFLFFFLLSVFLFFVIWRNQNDALKSTSFSPVFLLSFLFIFNRVSFSLFLFFSNPRFLCRLILCLVAKWLPCRVAFWILVNAYLSKETRLTKLFTTKKKWQMMAVEGQCTVSTVFWLVGQVTHS